MKENYYDVRNITDFKDLINQTVKLYGDRPAFRFKKRMYKILQKNKQCIDI